MLQSYRREFNLVLTKKKKMMKKITIMISLVVFSWAAFAQHDHSNMDHSMIHKEMNSKMTDQKGDMSVVTIENTNTASPIINDYMALKNALVKNDGNNAADAGKSLYEAFKEFNVSAQPEAHQKELTDIINDAKENAEHISKNAGDIEHQREHFELLSKDVEDLVMITGADRDMFQIYCPMYNHNEGGMWLSESKEIKNPLLGNKMSTCGTVQKEIAVK